MIFPIVRDTWNGPDGPVLNDALLTTAAESGMNGVHDRQPVILEKHHVLEWFDLSSDPAGAYPGAAPGALRLSEERFGFEPRAAA